MATSDIGIKIGLQGAESVTSGLQRVGASMGQLSGQVDTVRNALSTLAPTLAGALTVGGLVAFVRQTVNAVDAMNDLADATGASIEEISKLDQVARRNGASLDQVGGMLVKFNAQLKEADGKNGASIALQAIGLEAAKLRQLDPAEALRQTAVALAGFADDANKARITQELFGKSVREAAPFLKDLAEAGELQASVTSQQAAEAEKFNKQIFALQENASTAGRTIAQELLPTLSTIAAEFNRTNAAGDTLAKFFGTGLKVVLETLAVLATDVAFVFKGVGRDLGGMAAQVAALAKGDFAGFSFIRKALIEDSIQARKELDALQARILGVQDSMRAADAARAREDRGFVPGGPRSVIDIAGEQARRKAAEDATLAAAKALDIEAKAIGEAIKAREKYIETLSAGTDKIAKETQALADQVAQVVLGKQAFQNIIDAREEEQAVILETQAIRALDRNLDAKEFDSLKAQAQAIRDRINARKALATVTVEATDREITARRSALKDQDAQEIIDTERLKNSQSIIDAINREAEALQMSSVEREVTIALLAAEARGIKAGTYEYEEYAKKIRAAIVNRETVRASIEQTKTIEQEWRRTSDQIGQSLTDALMQGGKSAWEYIKGLFRSMVLRPIIQAVVNPVAGAFTAALGFSGAASASSGASALGNAGTLASAYNAINTGVSTAITNGFMKLAESPLGAKLGLSTPFDGGTGFTANIATSSSNTIASALGTAGGTIFGTAAGMAINKAISNGFQVSSGMNTLQNIGTAVASYVFGPIGGAVAGAISGAINRLFGRRLADVGLQGTFGAGAGFEGQSFQFYEGGFFRSDKTVTSPADAELQSSLSAGFRQIQVQTALLAQTVGQSAEEIGNFTQDIRLSFKGLTEDQIKEKLAEQLTSVQEQLAGLALGSSNYARAGETNVQTLTRLATSLGTINPALELLGLNLYATSLAGADLASQLADAFGGLENFTQATAVYYAEFFTEAERTAKTTAQLTETLGGLGLALPTTRDAFRQLVEAQDLTTEAGRKNFAVLVQLSGTFAGITPVVEDLADAGNQATEALRSAADILRERQGLERQLLQLQGDTAALRALDRAALDESNRALFDRITALQDSQAAEAAAAEATRTAAAAAEEAARAAAAETQRIGQERLGLERQLLQLQGDTATIRALERAALDESNRALFDRITALQDSQAAEAAAAEATRTAAAAAQEAARAAAAETQRIGQERLGLERQLLQLQGDTATIRALERAALDASNRALYDQIQALQDSQAAAQAAAQAESDLASARQAAARDFAAVKQRQAEEAAASTDVAFALVRRAIEAEAKAAQAALTQAFDAQMASIQRQQQAATASRDAAAETLSLASDIFKYLGDQIADLRGTVGAGMSAASAQRFIGDAITAARSTGVLPDQAALAQAVGAARGGLNAANFATAFDQRRATLLLAGSLEELQDLSGVQMSAAERALQVAEDQLAALQDSAEQARALFEQQTQAIDNAAAAQLAAAQVQVDALRGIDTRITTVADAILQLSTAVVAETAARSAAASAASTAASITRTGRNTDALPADWARRDAASKIEWFNANAVTVAELTQAGTGWADIEWMLNNGYKGFANGGMHMGGLRLVGERGPELEVTGPARYWSFNDTQALLADPKRREEALAAEIRELRAENAAQARGLVQMQARMNKVLERWDADGMPETRVVS